MFCSTDLATLCGAEWKPDFSECSGGRKHHLKNNLSGCLLREQSDLHHKGELLVVRMELRAAALEWWWAVVDDGGGWGFHGRFS